MSNPYQSVYDAIYRDGNLFGMDAPLRCHPFAQMEQGIRKNSVAVGGGAFGDEGKGRVVDELCAGFLRSHGRVVVYRWNGGANAGHTIVVEGKRLGGASRLALHQVPSGALTPNATAILGKGMVIHPGDLVAEIDQVRAAAGGKIPATLLLDEMAVLALDTHRAYEAALQDWESGGKGSTGRGISPAYADVLYRHPIRARDLTAADWQERLGKHYNLYCALVAGLGRNLESCDVPTLDKGPIQVGAKAEFLERLAEQRSLLLPFICDVYSNLQTSWNDPDMPFVFEGAQAVGLDVRFGVYPDVTASDPTFGGILASTEGLIQPSQIAVRAGAIKATYTSSVGTRRLPTMMDEALGHRIREDAHEYGATTKRPRDIAYIDIPCLRYLAQVSGTTHLVLTHLDIAYPDVPIMICTHYLNAQGQPVRYRPDQEYLTTVTPQYLELPSWDGAAVQGAKDLTALSQSALQYIAFLSQALGLSPLLGTTGPQRDALVSWIPA